MRLAKTNFSRSHPNAALLGNLAIRRLVSATQSSKGSSSTLLTRNGTTAASHLKKNELEFEEKYLWS